MADMLWDDLDLPVLGSAGGVGQQAWTSAADWWMDAPRGTRFTPLPSHHTFVVTQESSPVPLFRPGKDDVTALQPYQCAPLGVPLHINEGLPWEAFSNPELLVRTIRLRHYEQAFHVVPDTLFPEPSDELRVVRELMAATRAVKVLEDFIFHSAMLYWLNVHNRFFMRRPATSGAFSEQMPPYIFLFFNHIDVRTQHPSHTRKRSAESKDEPRDWAHEETGTDRAVAARLSLADFVTVAMARYATGCQSRDMAAFARFTLGKNLWLMWMTRGFVPLPLANLEEHFNASTAIAGVTDAKLTFDLVHWRPATENYVRKVRSGANRRHAHHHTRLCLPTFWTHLLLRPDTHILPPHVLQTANAYLRLCHARTCLAYWLSPQEYTSLHNALTSWLRQRCSDADLALLQTTDFGVRDTVVAPHCLSAVRLRYTFFTAGARLFLTPPAHICPQFKLMAENDEAFVDADTAGLLIRLGFQRQTEESMPLPLSFLRAPCPVFARMAQARNVRRMTEADAWATLRPDWQALASDTARVRRDAREFVRRQLATLPPVSAIGIANAVLTFDGAEPLRLAPAIIATLQRCDAVALDAALQLHRPPLLVALPNGTAWSSTLPSDVAERPDTATDVLQTLQAATQRALLIQLRSPSRLKALLALEPGQHRLRPSDVAMLHLLQHSTALDVHQKAHLQRLEHDAVTNLSSSLTGASCEVYLALSALLREQFGCLPDLLLCQMVAQLAAARVPQPTAELDRLLGLVIRDVPQAEATLRADARRQGEHALLRRLPTVQRILRALR